MTKKKQLIKELVELLSLLVDGDDYDAEYIISKYLVDMVYRDWEEY